MKRTIRFAAAAALISAAWAAAPADAGALSLGPAGTKITTRVYYPTPNRPFGPWGAIGYGATNGLVFGDVADFRCSAFQRTQYGESGVDASGTLNGGTSVTLATKFINCYDARRSDPSNGFAPATISAPGGIVLTLTGARLVTYQDGSSSYTYSGRLNVGSGGLTITTPTTSGTCTLTVPAYTLLGDGSVPTNGLSLNSDGFSLNGGTSTGTRYRYTGTTACGSQLAGTRYGFIARNWYQRLLGLQLTP